VAAIGGNDLPESSGVAPRVVLAGASGGTLDGELAVATAPHGQIAIVGRRVGAGGGEVSALQGPARGPFSVIPPGGELGAPFAVTNGYLGDLALTSRAGSEADPLQLHVERFYTHSFVRSSPAGASIGPIQALTVALDYRTDALVVWSQAGAVYAQSLPAKGSARPVQRLATAGSRVSLSAVISDNYRATVAWSEQRGSETRVYLDRSATGVNFGTPQLLERFNDVHGLTPPPASPRLIRLSTESVVLAWAAVSEGQWVIRVAALDEDGIGLPATIAAPKSDALLSDVAAGPTSDLLVLWTRPKAGAQVELGAPDQAIFASRGFRIHPDRMWFPPAEEVTSAGANEDAAAAFDPDTDRAVVAWDADGSVQYAVRAATGHPDISGR
jgi:hypothetical protein